MSLKDIVRTRFAPSPTGMMHIGGVRTALYAFLVARKNNGIFNLRIEDTDRKRIVVGSIEDIIENLKWLNLNFDQKPIYQSQRKDIYEKYARELVSKGLAYENEGAIWFKFPKEGKIVFTDVIGNRKIEFDNSSQKDFVLLKSDRLPTYHLAHVVDDHLMETNPVIRGEEWMPSIPKHILLFKAFNWNIPNYAHLPLILGTDRSKLSKRHGARSVSEFRKDGFLPEAILNYMALLGWTPPLGKEVISLEEMVREFDLKDVHTTSAVFDITKLEWMSGVYIREKLSYEDLKTRILDFYNDDKEMLDFVRSTRNFNTILELAKTRMKTLKDFKDLVLPPKREIKFSEEEKKKIEELVSHLEKVKKWEKDTILSSLKEFKEISGVSFKKIYTFITGKEQGLPLAETMEISGKEKVLQDLKKRNK